jgi:hypothetical protein
MSVTLAPMLPEHWEAVRLILQQGIDAGVATFETAVPEWSAWDAAHRADCRFVALDDGRVVGWAALSPVSARAAYAGVAEVSVYVAASAQRRADTARGTGSRVGSGWPLDPAGRGLSPECREPRAPSHRRVPGGGSAGAHRPVGRCLAGYDAPGATESRGRMSRQGGTICSSDPTRSA